MKEKDSKKKLIKCLKSLSYDDLISVVDWSKVAECQFKKEPTVEVLVFHSAADDTKDQFNFAELIAEVYKNV